MLGLFFVTILTSAADSVNPIAITQQFVLQGLVKKPGQIWFFILATGITNFISGLLSYYGLLSVLSNVFDALSGQFKQGIYIALFIVGVMLILFAIYYVFNQRNKPADDRSEETKEEEDKQRLLAKAKMLTPFSLSVLGVMATVTELATALPYFAFLAVLLNYELTVMEVILVLFIYNFIYILPQMVLYFIYKLKQEMFERFYLYVKKQMIKWAGVVVPLVLVSAGILLICYAVSLLSY